LDRKKRGVMIIVLIVGIMFVCIPLWQVLMPRINSQTGNFLRIKLPTPQYDSNVSIEETLLERRSIREYTDEPLTLQQVSQLLWAAQGITDPTGKRTAPSAGALYPLEVYVEVGNVENLGKGVYKYSPDGHELVKVLDGNVRSQLAQAALGQSSVENSAINIVIVAVFERTTVVYGDRGIRYVHFEVGHAAQNICLQATALNLGTVTVGSFDDQQVKEVLNLPEDEQPLYILPVGKK